MSGQQQPKTYTKYYKDRHGTYRKHVYWYTPKPGGRHNSGRKPLTEDQKIANKINRLKDLLERKNNNTNIAPVILQLDSYEQTNQSTEQDIEFQTEEDHEEQSL